MPIHTIWLINKAGGLAYHKTIDASFHPKISTNDCLVMASTFQRYTYFDVSQSNYIIHAISAKVSPIPGSGGIRHLELHLGGSPFHLYCLQSPTGVKILMTTTADRRPADPLEPENILKKAYVVYTDYALKNPFQPHDMPIRSEQFDSALLRAIM